MTLQELQKSMIAAMKSGDKERKEAISSLIAGTKKIAIDAGSRDNITEDMVAQAVSKELKTAKEQVETCPDSRPDLKAKYQRYYEIIAEFAPKQLSEEEIKKILSEKFSDVLSTGNMGQIMKAVMPELKGQADGKVISKAVSDVLKSME